MIHRSGSSARSLLPTSAATSRTWATSALSSVSGMVKNCGAWGSMAPPITVDIMVVLLVRKAIAREEEQQARRVCRSFGLDMRQAPCAHSCFTVGQEADSFAPAQENGW